MIKPIHALYYLLNNRSRVFILIALMSLISICYLGGLYISSPYYENLKTIDIYQDFTIVSKGIGLDKQDCLEFLKNVSSESNFGIGRVMLVSYFADQENTSGIRDINARQKISFTRLIGLPGGISMPIFYNSNNFSAFKNTAGLFIDSSTDWQLANGEMAMSDLLKRNLGLEKGAIIDNDGELITGFKQSSTLAQTYKSNGYTSFRIDSAHTPDSVLLLRENTPDKEKSREDFNAAVMQLKQEYPDLQFIDYEYQKNIINDVLAVYYAIIIVVALIVALILAIMINAILIGEYANRKLEFSIYKATGFSRWEITFKVIKETILINLLGLALGAVMVLLMIFVLNETVLFAKGLQLSYFCPESLIGTLICETVVIIPIIVFQANRIKKHDVTNF
ncbi:MAG: ABC transporter permease [Clostridiales bacterium]|jgi:ABC-type antimicrobial peptide transport system permease subunit|nr:ABC transporter permease [Clostridiales bacterium]